MTRRFNGVLILILPLVLYVLAMNPYLAPDTYDNVVYFEGAQSLATHGTYQSGGEWITDWPPFLSALLALPMLLGFHSVWAAKCVILLTIIVGIFYAHCLLVREERPLPLVSCFLCLLAPVGLLWGTRIMTEWPYLLFSFLFLNLLLTLRTRDSPGIVVLCGITLGASLLTRYVGVALIAALVLQAYERIRRHAAFPRAEASILAIGVLLFVGCWLLPLYWMRTHLGASSKYYHDASFLQWPSLGKLVAAMRDLFFFDSAWMGIPGMWLASALLTGAVLIALWGLVLSLYKGRTLPTDGYVLAMLVLFVVHDTHWTRYLLTMGPLLFSYLFLGLFSLWMTIPQSWHRSVRYIALVAFVVYIVGLLSMDIRLLLRGNSRTYNGLSYLVSPTPESYYAGNWHDLYLLCQKMRKDPREGSVAIYDLGETRYIEYFTQRRVIPFDPAEDFSFVIAPSDENIRFNYPDLHLQLVESLGGYSVYIPGNR